MSFRSLGAALAVALSTLACQPAGESLPEAEPPITPVVEGEAPAAGVSITSGSGALTSSGYRLAIHVGAAPAGRAASAAHSIHTGAGR